MSSDKRRFFPVPDKPKVVLVLQGGGALGAYHVGCYQALAEAGYHPDWVSGISIGAINAAIIAGNTAERRLERLEQLWADISRPDGWGHLLVGDLRRWFNLGSAMEAITWGQPNFFVPCAPGPLLAAPGTPQATSFYDTGPLRATLLRLTDFDQINRGTYASAWVPHGCGRVISSSSTATAAPSAQSTSWRAVRCLCCGSQWSFPRAGREPLMQA
jgi:predicted acylesterase/phospholipase RssA